MTAHSSGAAAGSSPHTRGARELRRHFVFDAGIIPAYAGSTRCAASSTKGRRDHPRIRGEHPRNVSHITFLARIIPAYAGSTSLGWLPVRLSEDHPRIRGEHYACTVVTELGEGSSPHTRGARIDAVDVALANRIIPAYAGST